MYNEYQKMRFISQYRDSDRGSIGSICESIFNTFEPYEEMWGADLCTRTKEELQPVIDKMMGLRSRTKYTKLLVLKDYVRWCLVMKVDGAKDDMLHIKEIGLDVVRTHTVKNPMELQRYLDVICEPESLKTLDNIYRCYYWLAYAGMEEEDILCVKSSDVDFDNMVVHYPKKYTTVPIYKEAVAAMKNCVCLDSFVYIHPNYKKEILRHRIDGDMIFRGVRGHITTPSMKAELSRRSKQNEEYTDLKLSYYRVWLSGVFYRMYIDEINGIEPYFEEIVVSQMREKSYKIDTEKQKEIKRKQLVREYKDDYERWKLVWH